MHSVLNTTGLAENLGVVVLCRKFSGSRGPKIRPGPPEPPGPHPSLPPLPGRPPTRRPRAASARNLGDQLAEGGDETFVLGFGADRHAQRAGAPERVAGADKYAALAQPGDHLAFVRLVRQVQPDEVRI